MKDAFASYEDMAESLGIDDSDYVIGFEPLRSKYTRGDEMYKSEIKKPVFSYERAEQEFRYILRELKEEGKISEKLRYLSKDETVSIPNSKKEVNQNLYKLLVGPKEDVMEVEKYLKDQANQFLEIWNRNLYQEERDDHQALRMMAIMESSALTGEEKEIVKNKIHDNQLVTDILSIEELDPITKAYLKEANFKTVGEFSYVRESCFEVEDLTIDEGLKIVDVIDASKDGRQRLEDILDRELSEIKSRSKDLEKVTLAEALSSPNKSFDGLRSTMEAEVHQMFSEDVERRREARERAEQRRLRILNDDKAVEDRVVSDKAKNMFDDANGIENKKDKEHVLTLIAGSVRTLRTSDGAPPRLSYNSVDEELRIVKEEILERAKREERTRESIDIEKDRLKNLEKEKRQLEKEASENQKEMEELEREIAEAEKQGDIEELERAERELEERREKERECREALEAVAKTIIATNIAFEKLKRDQQSLRREDEPEREER